MLCACPDVYHKLELNTLARSGSWQELGSDNPQQKRCLAAGEFVKFLEGKGVRRLGATWGSGRYIPAYGWGWNSMIFKVPSTQPIP